MFISENLRDIGIHSNVNMTLRQGGKIVETRSGHNVFTITGRNLLSKLISWNSLGPPDVPFTNKRTRWVGVGKGSQLEVTTVESLVEPVEIQAGVYMVPVQTVEFPNSTSVRFIREFSALEINVGSGAPVTLTEAALYADVTPALYALTGHRDGTEDTGYAGDSSSTLNPGIGTNSPIAYKAFEGLTKTVDFILEIRWDFRF
jgi:hypothetical protein